MMQKFLNEFLKLTDYNAKIDSTGNQNITQIVELSDGRKIVVQQMKNIKSIKNIEFQTKIFNKLSFSNAVLIAKNVEGFERFYEFEGEFFQIMEFIDGKTFSEDNFTENLVIKSVQKLANFHKELQNFDGKGYEDIDFSRVLFRILPIAREKSRELSDSGLKNAFLKMEELIGNHSENFNLPKGIIHGDPIFRNFIIDKNGKNIIAMIDYDRMCYNSLLWDFVDLIRGFLRFQDFDKKLFEKCIFEYNKIREFTLEEKKEMKNYCQMINLDVGYRFFLGEFEGFQNKNLYNNTAEKIERYVKEYQKVSTFFS